MERQLAGGLGGAPADLGEADGDRLARFEPGLDPPFGVLGRRPLAGDGDEAVGEADRGVGAVGGERGLHQEALGLRRLAVARLVDRGHRLGQPLRIGALAQLLLDRRHQQARRLRDLRGCAQDALELPEPPLGGLELGAQRRVGLGRLLLGLGEPGRLVGEPSRPAALVLDAELEGEQREPSHHRSRQTPAEDPGNG